MDKYTISEEAFKSGYEQGKRDTLEKVRDMMKQSPYIDFTEEWVIDEIIGKLTNADGKRL